VRKIVSSLLAAGVFFVAADGSAATTANKPHAATATKTDKRSVKTAARKVATKTAKKPSRLPKLPPPSLTGIASVYSYKRTRRGASGELLRFNTLIAAHRTFKFGTRVKVTNRRNGKEVVVRIVDRGPYIRGRVIDLSPAAAHQIGLGWSIAPVTLSVVSGKAATTPAAAKKPDTGTSKAAPAG
jgi:rare lipoprotein A